MGPWPLMLMTYRLLGRGGVAEAMRLGLALESLACRVVNRLRFIVVAVAWLRRRILMSVASILRRGRVGG